MSDESARRVERAEERGRTEIRLPGRNFNRFSGSFDPFLKFLKTKEDGCQVKTTCQQGELATLCLRELLIVTVGCFVNRTPQKS
jgi:hypothetical protein